MKKMVVIGSLNMDLVTYVPQLPSPGETISSSKFQKNPGGKGANQAVAAAKLGADVTMVGKVGADAYGAELLNSLKESGVSTRGVRQADITGMAFIQVSMEGENNIVLVPGANAQMQCADIDEARALIEESELILLQLEIPLEAVEHALRLGVELKKEVILNPAPARKLPQEMLRMVHTLIPNESELHLLTGMPVSTQQELFAAADQLKSYGVKRLIVTMGQHGAYLINDDERVHIPAFSVDAVDTTAAGDSFISGFAVGKARGMSDREAVVFASRVAAIVVTREGAQPSLPTLAEVEQLH